MNYSDILSDPEFRRFANQILLSQVGIEGQKKLKKAKIAVIGAGGLGSFVLQYLAAIGIGHLGIIDHSLVEEVNIQRQVLYGGNDLGKLKTIISKQNLQNLFPFINFEIVNIELSISNSERIIEQFDLIVDATNNDVFHALLSDACIELKKPWIYGSINEFKGEIAVFDSNNGLGYNNSQITEKRVLKENNQNNGGIALSYGFIGNLMAMEVFKFLMGNHKSLNNKILTIDLLSYQFSVKSLL